MTSAARGDAFVDEARSLGYEVELRAPGFARPDLGLSMPSVYAVTGFGASMLLLRSDDLDAWNSLVSRDQHEQRLRRLERTPIKLSRPAPPRLIGPVPSVAPGDPSRDYPQMASALDLASAGYVEEEYFLDGLAASLATPELEYAIAVSDGHAYRTRMIVRRPVEGAAFNGTAMVEWLNVTNAANVDQLWLEVGPHLIARGTAYVGVSVQRVGVHAPVTGLRAWSPQRYGTLDLTERGALVDDSLCFDVFTQAALAVRGQADIRPLGPLVPDVLLAYGGSQSAMRLRLYYNSVHPHAQVFDGFMLALAAGRLRTDLDAAAFRIWTETELLRGAAATRQPDTDTVRTWEIPGSSHLSFQMAQAREALEGRGDVPGSPWQLAGKPPLARVPWGHALVAGLEHLTRWSAGGPPPPSAPPIETETTPDGTTVAVRDVRGNALGGLRLSQHEVATATNHGLNDGSGWARLWGSHERFDDATLRLLYPDAEAYVERVRDVDARNLEAGYLTEDAAAENLAAAEAEPLGR